MGIGGIQGGCSWGDVTGERWIHKATSARHVPRAGRLRQTPLDPVLELWKFVWVILTEFQNSPPGYHDALAIYR